MNDETVLSRIVDIFILLMWGFTSFIILAMACVPSVPLFPFLIIPYTFFAGYCLSPFILGFKLFEKMPWSKPENEMKYFFIPLLIMNLIVMAIYWRESAVAILIMMRIDPNMINI